MDLAQRLEKIGHLVASPLQKGILINGYLHTKNLGSYSSRQIAQILHNRPTTESQLATVRASLEIFVEKGVMSRRTVQQRDQRKKIKYELDISHPVVDAALLTVYAMRAIQDPEDSLWSDSLGGGFRLKNGKYTRAAKPLHLLSLYDIPPDELDLTPQEWAMVEPQIKSLQEVQRIFKEKNKATTFSHIRKLLSSKLIEELDRGTFLIIGDLRAYFENMEAYQKKSGVRAFEAALRKKEGLEPGDTMKYEDLPGISLTRKQFTRYVRTHPELFKPQTGRESKYQTTNKGKYYVQNVVIPLIQILQGYNPPIAQQVRSLPLRELRGLERYVHQQC